MYSASFTRKAIETAADKFNAQARLNNRPEWTPRYHSLNQIDSAIHHFNDLWDPERKELRRPLNKEEAAFVRNERLLCALDFRGYWLPNYSWIINWKQQPEHCTPNVAQNIVMDLWAEREEMGVAIWMFQLKARRLGVSTISEMAVQHRFQFHKHSNCVVASADPTKSLEMAGMIAYSLSRQPFWLIPQGKPKIQHGMPVEYPDIDTSLTIQAGNQFTGVARGATPNVIHLSEMASWPDARQQIDGSLMKAVVDSPNVFAIMETTAWGTGNWVHDTWEIAKSEQDQGRSRILPIFLPWFVGTDLYPSEADLRARPIDPKWTPSDRVIAHAERARKYVLSNPMLFKYLAKGDKRWTLPREQMWYHEIEYDQARKKKELNIFLSELPADDFECFQSPNLPIIDPEILIGYKERTRPPIGVYTIVGPDIPQALVAPKRQWDSSKPPIAIHTRDIVGRYDVKFQLIPLKFEGYPTFKPELKLLIWEWPEPGVNYGVGVDCSEGIGQDLAAIEVLREATPTLGPGQVAEWASAHVTAFQLWPLVMAVGCLYSTHKMSAGRRVQCRLAIEAWTNGSATQNELQKRGWSNFHPWKYNDKRKPTKDADVNRVGVYTNQWFRASTFDMLLTNLSEEAIDLPSPFVVEELARLERRDGTQKIEASYGAHDDRVMALGFPLFSLHMNKPAVRQYARKRVAYVPGDEGEVKPNYAIWRPDNQALDLPNPALLRPYRTGGLRGQVELLGLESPSRGRR